MKAPDKIYIRHYWMPGELDDDWHLKPIEGEDYEEYIRKDTLLEWAKKELEKRRNTGDDYYLPAFVVLNDLIEKLNEL